MSGRGVFVRQGGAYELGASLVASAQSVEVPSCFRKAQPAVGPASHSVSIVIVLPVILPKAHRTDLEVAALTERQEAAAGTWVRAILRLTLDIDQRSDHPGMLPDIAAAREPISTSCPASGAISLGSLGFLGAVAALTCGGAVLKPGAHLGASPRCSPWFPAGSGTPMARTPQAGSWRRAVGRQCPSARLSRSKPRCHRALLSQELPEAEPQSGDTDEGGTPCPKRGIRGCPHHPESGRAQHCDDERTEHDDRCPEAPKR
ncbi:hypothetical protein QFZ22_004795 [Streptomyces canus]|uniref:Uncharacterized protein n=1 Tax=Streptomyces canus TaxID=58343 RepID=A0AAW8FI39_9ACTN|nr:hypothetical protein [Streptomyces canus]